MENIQDKQTEDHNNHDQDQDSLDTEVEQEIYLSKKNGVWFMAHYKDGLVNYKDGKDLVLALIDTTNPLVSMVVDGPVLGNKYNGLYVKYSTEDDTESHKCFESNKQNIMNVLDNEGLVLAFSPDKPKATEQFQKYLEEHDIQEKDIQG